MTESDPPPHGVDIALRGVGLAHGRLLEGVRKYLRGDDRQLVSIALSEALFWIAAMDEHGRDHVSDYARMRGSSRGGRTVGGLVYARNFHVHELISTSETAYKLPERRAVQGPTPDPPGRGRLLEIQLRWTAFDNLPAPNRAERHGRDKMYHEHVAERPLSHPIADARTWLEAALR